MRWKRGTERNGRGSSGDGHVGDLKAQDLSSSLNVRPPGRTDHDKNEDLRCPGKTRYLLDVPVSALRRVCSGDLWALLRH